MTDAELLTLYDDATFGLLDGHLAGLRAVERAARAAEREACARIADERPFDRPGWQIAAAIRNRAEGQQ